MNKANLVVILLVSACAWAHEHKSYSGYKVLRTEILDQAKVANVRDLENIYDFWRSPRSGAPVDIMASPRTLPFLVRFLTKLGITYHTLIEDVGSVVQNSTASGVRSRGLGPINLEEYHTYEDMIDFVEEMAKKHDFVTIEELGKTFEGRDMKLMKIDKPGKDKTVIWIEAGIHAREWISPAVTLQIINDLLSGKDKQTLELYTFYIIVSMNPDGYEHSRLQDRLWRKNRSYNGNDCKGVDLNRNFDFHFAESGVSPFPCSEVYPGEKGFSEKESSNVRDYLLDNKIVPDFAMCLHSYSQVWLYPYGYARNVYADNAEEQVEVANVGIQAMMDVHGKTYEALSAGDFYPAAGAADDYYAGVIKAKFVSTIELRDTGRYGFLLPEDQIKPTFEETWAGIKAAMAKIREIAGRE